MEEANTLRKYGRKRNTKEARHQWLRVVLKRQRSGLLFEASSRKIVHKTLS
jgi:hypothetical protein